MRILIFFILLTTTIFSQDTLKIASGKPYCLLVDILKEEQSIGEDTDKKELKKNFKDRSLEVLHITEHVFVLFENGQSFDFTSKSNYNSLIFWGGKLTDSVKLRNGNFQNATEFVAKEMKLDRKSSYNLYKTRVDSLLEKAENITEKSKEILNIYLQKRSFSILLRLDVHFLKQDLKNVKKITSTFKRRNKIKTGFIELDKDGKFLAIKYFGNKDPSKFTYQNGVIKKVVTGDQTNFITYDDDKMIILYESEYNKEIYIISIKKDLLLKKGYLIDKRFSNKNFLFETKLEGKCFIKTINKEMNRKECFSRFGFPYQYNYTSYQDGEILQELKSYFIKEEGVLKLYYFNEKGDKKLRFKIYFNDRNLISKIISADNKIKYEYKYTYFK